MMNGHKEIILIVDDVLDNLKLLMEILPEYGYEVRPFPNGRLALQAAKQEQPDLILLDLMMPEMDGFEVCTTLKDDPQLKEIPVIFLSASGDIFDKVRGFQIGGVDYITKPFQIEEVLVRIDTHLTLMRQKRALVEKYQNDLQYLESLNKLKDDLIQTTKHDLKNPLASVTLSVNLLERRGHITDEKDLETLQNIGNSVSQMNQLISNVLDIATLDTGYALEFRWVSPIMLVLNVIQTLQILFDENQLDFDFIHEITNEEVYVDPDRFQQVLGNILGNAIKYTPEGGRIVLHLNVTPDRFEVEISDSGLGIPAEDIPHLFERFYRIQQEEHLEAEGTGLGLYIVKRIIEQHDGEIWVESELGKGSSFFISIPQPEIR